jgi:hypothetical protein
MYYWLKSIYDFLTKSNQTPDLSILFFLLLLLFWPLSHSFETSPARQIDPEFKTGTGLSLKK